MKFIEVKEKQHIKEFLEFPIQLYKGIKEWIRPLDNDVEEVFDPNKNSFFQHGECARWIVTDDKNKTIGRFAAFIDTKTEKQKNSLEQKLHVGGMGFFESIQDKEVAFAIFDYCKKWLDAKGMNAMDGPINFGERDNWWGLLIEGHDIEPNYKMPYTLPVYQEYFEEYGFQIYFKQITYGRKINAALHPTYVKVAERIFANKEYEFAIFDSKKTEKFTQDFCSIYNKAWAGHEGIKEMSMEQARSRIQQLKQIIDPDIVYFAYHNGEPVAFYINIPELNQVVKTIKNGKLNWIAMLKFAWQLKIAKTNRKMMGLVFGVIPEYQRKGVMIAIVEFCRRYVQEKIRGRYIDFEMNWIGDFNPKMMKVSAGIGDPCKIHHTYRKIFDSNIEFERCPEMK
jgi:GNAT superfamily N-acetyltransferase